MYRFIRPLQKPCSSGRGAGFITKTPSGKYSRQIGFLYEFLTGEKLPMPRCVYGNYVDLVNPQQYVLPDGVKDTRWRVNNNLPGTSCFCPLVRRTEKINRFMAIDFSGAIRHSLKNVPANLFKRAVNYLYFKETRSSNDIERETPSRQREELFVNLLSHAGMLNIADRLSEDELTRCQNIITDHRFHNIGYRDNQNYVGESNIYGRSPIVHLIGMPPQYLHETMQGIAEFSKISQGINPIVRATSISFGFVFVHPFEDGNGRLHRFLFNDVMANDGVLPKGVILPISAVMLKNPYAYNLALEQFSKPLMDIANYDLDEDERMTVNNPEMIVPQYQYPDLTSQVEYMFSVVEQTINTELVNEVKTIQLFDQVRSDIKDIVDLPNYHLELMIKLLHQGQGVLSKNKRKRFPMLLDQEITAMEAAYKEAFEENMTEINPAPRPE